MLTVYDIIYYLIYIVCLYFCFRARETNIPGFLYIKLMLCCGLVTEIAVEIFQYNKLDDNKPYYFYIPLEYCLLVLFYASNTNSKLFKNVLYSSIAVYLAICFFLIFRFSFSIYPSAIYNASCVLNTIWVIILFFDLGSINDLPITRLPLFWIYTALLIFYAGIFFFNGAYNYFLQNDSILAKDLRNYINTGLNYVLYSTLTYGFICSGNIKKY